MSGTGEPSDTKRSRVEWRWRFLCDLLLGTGLSIVPYAVVLALFFFSGKFWVAYFVAPGLVLLYGAIRRRPGMVTAPILLAVGFSVATAAVKMHQTAAVHAFAPAGIKAPEKAHSVLAIEGPRLPDERAEGGPGCEADCVQVLATSSYAFAKKQFTTSWSVYRRGTGPECRTGEGAASALAFIQAGYIGACAVQSTETTLDDGLLYRVTPFRGAPPADLPVLDHGWILEVVERNAGQDQLLGRRFIGARLVWPLLALAYPAGRWEEQIVGGPPLGRREFIAWALHLPVGDVPNSASIAQSTAFGPAPLAARLDAVETYLDDPKTAAMAARTWANIADSRPHGGEGDFWEPRIDRLLASRQAERITAALLALRMWPQEKRDFAAARLTEIAFSPLVGVPHSPIIEAMESHLASWSPPTPDGGRGSFPPAVRTRARALLATDPRLSPAQRQIFFRMLTCDGWGVRRDGMDALFSLRGRAYMDTVEAIGGGYRLIFSGTGTWSAEDKERLVARTSGVPTSRIVAYIRAFKGYLSREQRAVLVERLRSRLAAAEGARSPGQQQLDDLRRLMTDLTPSGR